jgi:hypothetical protein
MAFGQASPFSAITALSLFKLLKVSVFSLLGLQLFAACQVAFGDFTIDSSKLAVSCRPNVARCDGSTLETCVNGNDWKVLATCSSPDLCDLTRLSCKPCLPGAAQCNGAQPQACGADGRWHSTVAPCLTTGLCTVMDETMAFCAAPGCPGEGQVRCAGDHLDHLQRCPASLTNWLDVEICASAKLCDADAANAQIAAGQFPTCVVPTCATGQFNCETGSPRPCNADRNGWQAATTICPPGSPCNLKAGDCSACATGTAVCSGKQLSLCDQQAWTGSACSSVLSCVAAPMPACDLPTCTAGAFRCNESALERCRGDGGKWEFVDQCGNNALCNPDPEAARCEAAACVYPGTRCKGDQPQHCRENLTGWDDYGDPCIAPNYCNPDGGCLATPCTDGSYRCNDVVLELCMNAAWVRHETCVTKELCDPENPACTLPTCAPGKFECVGAILKTCNDGRDGWHESQTCTGNQVCNADTGLCQQR